MEDTKELVQKCHQTDKHKYMIAFDGENHSQAEKDHSTSPSRLDARLIHDSFSLNNYLRNSLYRLKREEAMKELENNMNHNTLTDDDESNSSTTVTRTPSSQVNQNLTYLRSESLLASNPLTDDDDYHDQLEHQDSLPSRRTRASQDYNSCRSPFIPIFDLQATSFTSPSATPDISRKKILSSASGSIQSSYSSMVTSSDPSSPLVTPSQETRYPTGSRVANPSMPLPPACLVALERLKQGTSPIREEDELSYKSSKAEDIHNKNNGRQERKGSEQVILRGKRSLLKNKSSSIDNPNPYSNRIGNPYPRNLNHYYYPHNAFPEASNTYQQQLNQNDFYWPHTQPKVNPYNPFDPTSLGYVSRGQFGVRSAPQTPVTATNARVRPNSFYGQKQAFNVPPTFESRRQEDIPSQNRKKVYVCYPNYSLPDVSFLTDSSANSSQTKDAQVLFSPTKPVGRSPPVRKERPKSLNDFDRLSRSTIRGVRDWDSLSFLLPDQAKVIMGQRGLLPVPEGEPTSCSPKTAPTFVKMRHRILPRVPVEQKRRSLQEPMSPFMVPSPSLLTKSESMQFQCPVASQAAQCCHNYVPVHCCKPKHSCHCQCLKREEEDPLDILCSLLSMQEEVKHVGELFGKMMSSKECNGNKEIVVSKAKPKTLPIRASTGFKSMIPVAKSPRSTPTKIMPNQKDKH